MDTTAERTTTSDGKAVLMRFFEASETGDMDAARALVADDVVMEWPQSGERFHGRDNAFGAMMATEVKPRPAGEPRIAGGGEIWVLTMPLDYGGEIHHYVGIFEIRNGQIHRTSEYFGAPFPAPEARAKFAEPR
jgi:hypothetical protein